MKRKLFLAAGRSDAHAAARPARAPARGKARALVPAAVETVPVGDITERKRRDLELQRFRAAMDAIGDAIYLSDRPSMRFVDVNRAACEMTGKSREALLDMRPEDILGISRQELERVYDSVIAGGADTEPLELLQPRPNGSQAWVELRRRAYRSDAGWLIVSVVCDISERKQKEEELRESEARYHALAGMSADWYWEHDEYQRLTKVSDHVFANVEVNGEALLGKTLWEMDIRYAAAARAALEADIEARRPLRDFNFTRITASGVERHVQISGEPMVDAAGRFCGYHGIGRDITDRIHAEERLAYLAQYDSLTGVANRELFRDRLAQSLTEAERNASMVGVLYIDLDGFKGINDAYGHAAGDRLLVLVAERLQSCVRSSDTVGRLGGDEFAIVLANLDEADRADLVAEQAVAQLAQPFALNGRQTLITASIGISIYPLDGMDANLLLKNADTAMYQGKEQGRNNFQNYSVELDHAAACRRQLELELRHAIDHEEFELHYQPQVSLDNGRVIGVEAMLRWWHPVHGMLTAAEFIEIAEETGLIVQIGHWVFEAACKQAAEWQRAGFPELFVAVNVSPVEIERGRVVEQVQRALERSGLAARYLEIELTESVIMADAEAFTNTLVKLKDLGISIAIDDFGTGYSSLSSLKNFPIDKVKIDQAFTRDIVTNPDDSAIVQAVIAMSHHLQLEVVAKGVETESQAGLLRRCRCDIAQGFLFGAPMQAAHLKELLDDSHGRLLPARSSLDGPAPQFPLAASA